jgi:cytidine deaminase
MDVKKIVEKAIEGRSKSYSPYSKFKVGAAILLKNGEYIMGCNVENISYGLTICAERNALFQLVSAGYSKDDVEAFCVVGDTTNPISPCGACRQVMAELLDENTPVVLANMNDETKLTTVKDLLPYCFEEIEV